MPSKRYRGDDPKQKLQDIAERFALIREFLENVDRASFLEDKKTHHAVAKVAEEICEAAYWFAKHKNGAELRNKYPSINSQIFGDAGNVIRYEYWWTDYGRLCGDLHGGSDIAALEEMVESEIPFYRRVFQKGSEA